MLLSACQALQLPGTMDTWYTLSLSSGARMDEYEIMAKIASDLDVQDILDLAAYYSSLGAE